MFFFALLNVGKIRVLGVVFCFLWGLYGLKVGFILKYVRNEGNRPQNHAFLEEQLTQVGTKLVNLSICITSWGSTSPITNW